MKGSFTVELSILFPGLLIVLIFFMQIGMYFVYRIYTISAVDQGLVICNRARQEKKTTEETVQLVETYLYDTLVQLPIDITELKCEVVSGWFAEEYSIRVTAGYSFILKLSWNSVGKCSVMNPVEFRNRVDFVWEKGNQYMDQLKRE